MSNKRRVYESLLKLVKHLIDFPDANTPAICAWVEGDIIISPGEIQSVLHPIFKTWPKFSGSINFPVTTKRPGSPEYMYGEVRKVWGGYWNRNTEYGANRRELLTFLIHSLLTQIHDEENNQPSIKKL